MLTTAPRDCFCVPSYTDRDLTVYSCSCPIRNEWNPAAPVDNLPGENDERCTSTREAANSQYTDEVLTLDNRTPHLRDSKERVWRNIVYSSFSGVILPLLRCPHCAHTIDGVDLDMRQVWMITEAK